MSSTGTISFDADALLVGEESQITFYIVGLSAVKVRAFKAVTLDIPTINSKDD